MAADVAAGNAAGESDANTAVIGTSPDLVAEDVPRVCAAVPDVVSTPLVTEPAEAPLNQPPPVRKQSQPRVAPCTPQKEQQQQQQQWTPQRGQQCTPPTRTPHSGGGSSSKVDEDWEDEDMPCAWSSPRGRAVGFEISCDGQVEELDSGIDDAGDAPGLPKPSLTRASPATPPGNGTSAHKPNDGMGVPRRQRRRGGNVGNGEMSGVGGGGGSRFPAPPPTSSLKALPPDQVERFFHLVQEGDYAEALRALRRIRRAVRGRGCSKEAFGGTRALLHHLLEGYALAGRLPEALELLEDMKKGTEARLVSAAACNALLRGLLARGALNEARHVVRDAMPRLGVAANEASLNLLMDAAARAGHAHLEEAWDVLEELQRRSLRADKYTVSILTKGITDRGDRRRTPRGVALVERFLRTQPEDVDEVLVNSLLDVFSRTGDLPRLEATLRRMREQGIRGSAVTYGTIVKAYGRAGNIEKVLEAWDELSREGLEANAVTYGCMLDACVKCGHLDRALQVFGLMKQNGLHRNTILYATLIKGFAKSKDPLAARNLHREMITEGVPCNIVVFNSLVDACVRANDLQGAAEVLQQLTAAGVQPDLITFTTLIKGYCSSGELNKATRLAAELNARDLECDEIVYNSLLEGCVKAGDLQLGLQLFAEMRQQGVRPSSVTFSILVKLLAGAGRLDLACHLVAREMRELHGVAPTRMVWSCLVTSCVKARDLGRAVIVLDTVDRESGAAGGARASMYATVIDGCLAQAQVSTALALCERAFSRSPVEEGGNSRSVALSAELLRRVFEAASARGSEAEEARAVLERVSQRLGDGLRTSLEELLGRGGRRSRGPNRSEQGCNRGFDRAGYAAAPVSLGLSDAQAQQWPSPSMPFVGPRNPFTDQSAALAVAAATANGLLLQGDWDQSAVSAAMSAALGFGNTAHGDCWGNQWPAAAGGAEGRMTAYGYSGSLCGAWPHWEESSTSAWSAAGFSGIVGEVPAWTATLPGVLPPGTEMEEEVSNFAATGDVPPGLAAMAAHDGGEHSSPVQLLLSGNAGIGVSCY